MTTAKVTPGNGKSGRAKRTAVYLDPMTVEAVKSFQEWECLPRSTLGYARRRARKLTFGQAIDELVPLALERLQDLRRHELKRESCSCTCCQELREGQSTPAAVDEQIDEAMHRG